MKLYQILNKQGHPAGYELINPSALFPSHSEATEFEIQILQEEAPESGPFEIVEITDLSQIK